jgi:amino acid transporter
MSCYRTASGAMYGERVVINSKQLSSSTKWNECLSFLILHSITFIFIIIFIFFLLVRNFVWLKALNSTHTHMWMYIIIIVIIFIIILLIQLEFHLNVNQHICESGKKCLSLRDKLFLIWYEKIMMKNFYWILMADD